MAIDRIDFSDVQRVLQTGAVVAAPAEDLAYGNHVAEFQGRDLNGRLLSVVLAVGPGRKVTLMTAYVRK